ncbi:MAG: membrane protein insertion efficiency factor YidD [Proteobacteria bacterium]|nr:MAG: membrane protein insertion efficiency factor YidD [Pseudomonadota bacterium]
MRRLRHTLAGAATRCMIYLVKAYRLGVSPLLSPCCRHLPTCSEYFVEALERHGPIVGSYYGIRRIVRCHPWGTSGFDPVPPTRIPPRPHQ